MSFNLDSLADWLAYLESRHTDTIQLGLERVRACASRFGLTETKAVVITVAGTNGKGSTVAALDAIYRAAGFRVGSYTSPHLVAFNERIRINHEPITDDALCAVFKTLHAAPESAALTYFEMATMAALLAFQAEKLDVMILEVGMGGRLDATNLMDADLSIITTIDFDHQAWLGDTRDAIGYEKAGILRQGKPAIYADDDCPASITAYAQSIGVSLLYLGTDYAVRTADKVLTFELKATHETHDLPRPLLNSKAVAAALMATVQLQARLPVLLAHWVKGVLQASIQGRLQCIAGPVMTLLDVAHNPQAVALLASFVEQHVKGVRIHAVFSGLKDKDLCGLIKPMQPLVDAWYVAQLDGARAADERQLRAAFSDLNQAFSTYYPTPISAYRAAMDRAKPGDWVVVYGSFLTVGAVIAADMTQEK